MQENGTLRYEKNVWFCKQKQCIIISNISLSKNNEILNFARNNSNITVRGIVQNTKVINCDFSDMKCEKDLELVIGNYNTI